MHDLKLTNKDLLVNACLIHINTSLIFHSSGIDHPSSSSSSHCGSFTKNKTTRAEQPATPSSASSGLLLDLIIPVELCSGETDARLTAGQTASEWRRTTVGIVFHCNTMGGRDGAGGESFSNSWLTFMMPRAWDISYMQPFINCQGKSATHFLYFWSHKTLP